MRQILKSCLGKGLSLQSRRPLTILRMPRAVSTTVAIALLIVGVIVGSVGVYVVGTGNQSTVTTTVSQAASTTTVTKITTVTIGETTTTTATTSLSSSTSSAQLSFADLESALKNTANATIGKASYDFGKGTLDMWVLNNGTGPILLAPQMIIYNGAYVNNTYFTVLDQRVQQFGIYAYMPVGTQIIVQLGPNPPPITPSTATVEILNNTFTFVYGTSKD